MIERAQIFEAVSRNHFTQVVNHTFLSFESVLSCHFTHKSVVASTFTFHARLNMSGTMAVWLSIVHRSSSTKSLLPV